MTRPASSSARRRHFPTSGERTITADYRVAALPPHIMARVPTNLGDALTAALRTPTLTPVGSRGPDLQRGSSKRISTSRTSGMRRTASTAGAARSSATTTPAPTRAPTARCPDQRVERAVTQGVKIHDEKYQAQLSNAFSVARRRAPHIEAGWVGWRSRTTGEYAPLNEPQGRVYFTGDWLSYWIAWQNGAFDSARKVVSAIRARVQAGG